MRTHPPPDHICGTDCGSYAPGHLLHFIAVKLVNGAPEGWREGQVTLAIGTLVRVRYDEDDEVALWHHRPVPVEPGAHVRVHEEVGVLAVDGTWHHVRLAQGRARRAGESARAGSSAPPFAITELRSGTGRATADRRRLRPGPRHSLDA